MRRLPGGAGGPNIFVSLLLRSFIWGGFGYFAGCVDSGADVDERAELMTASMIDDDSGGVGAFGTGQYAMLSMVKAEKLKAENAAAGGQVPP